MPSNLTPSLEDYLETIYLLQRGDAREARVRDIVAARSVKASSVSAALKRLSEMGYLQYEQRELIRLTDSGKAAARRVYARHILLFQFFHDILGMAEERAREEACGLEHALSDEGMDRFVQFFESRMVCARCMSHMHPENCGLAARVVPAALAVNAANLSDGESAVILRINASGQQRQDILNMGFIPNVRITRIGTSRVGITYMLENHHIDVSVEQANNIIIEPE